MKAIGICVWSAAVALCAVQGGLTSRVRAQEPVPAQPVRSAALPLEPEPTARIVKMDAIVIDKRGRPVPNLQAADFALVENGVSQKILAVEPAGGERVVALLLDEFHVSAGPNTSRVREAAMRFVNEQLRPSDRLVVLKPLDSLTSIQFSRERDAARQAIETFNGRKGDYTALSEFEEKYIGRAPEAVQAARVQIVLSGLRALATSLGELNAGRAAIVLVTEGFSREARDARRDRERRVPDVQGLVRAASRHNIAIYGFNPADPPADAPAPNGGGKDGDAAILEALAAQTGGEAITGSAALDAAFQRVSRDLEACYLLSYASSHSGEGRFYDVQVRTRVADAQVRMRSGYWAPLRIELASAADSRPAPPPRMLKRSVLIDTWLGLVVGPEGTQQVVFTWEPAVLRGRSRALSQPSIVAMRVTTKEGAVLFEGELRPPRSSLGPVRDQAAVFDADPGRIQLDLEVLAADGTSIDKAAHDVDVPDINRADPLILPPQVFRCASAREFREISENPYAAPVPSRQFRRTDRLFLRVPTHSKSGADVTLTARVVNRVGQVLREIQPMKGGNGAPAQFDIPLSWLAPADYTIELTAKSAAGNAREVIRIRVTG
jgi:VWFA-related protein